MGGQFCDEAILKDDMIRCLLITRLQVRFLPRPPAAHRSNPFWPSDPPLNGGPRFMDSIGDFASGTMLPGRRRLQISRGPHVTAPCRRDSSGYSRPPNPWALRLLEDAPHCRSPAGPKPRLWRISSQQRTIDSLRTWAAISGDCGPARA